MPWVGTEWVADAASGVSGGTTYLFDTRLVVIENELITYASINSSGLVGAKRGAYGTMPASHAAGVTVGHLAQMYGELLPRPDSELAATVATRVAQLYTGCGFDMVYVRSKAPLATKNLLENTGGVLRLPPITVLSGRQPATSPYADVRALRIGVDRYFDGAEGMAALGSWQVPIAMFQQLFFDKIAGADILVEGSSISPYTWWLNARANTGDYAFIDPKAYMDVQKSGL